MSTRLRSVFSFPNPVNEVAARVVAGGVVVLCVLAIALRQQWLLVLLAYGFWARVLTGPTLSPLGQLATRVIVPRLPGGAPPGRRPAQALRPGHRRGVLLDRGGAVVRVRRPHRGVGRHRPARRRRPCSSRPSVCAWAARSSPCSCGPGSSPTTCARPARTSPPASPSSDASPPGSRSRRRLGESVRRSLRRAGARARRSAPTAPGHSRRSPLRRPRPGRRHRLAPADRGSPTRERRRARTSGVGPDREVLGEVAAAWRCGRAPTGWRRRT